MTVTPARGRATVTVTEVANLDRDRPGMGNLDRDPDRAVRVDHDPRRTSTVTRHRDRDRDPAPRRWLRRLRPADGQGQGQASTVTVTPTADVMPPTPGWISAADWFSTGPLALIVGGFAASGQHEFARWVGVEDPWAWFATALFELIMFAFLIQGYKRARDNLSPAPMWAVAAGIGGLSIYTNIAHTGSVGAGVLYGSASLGVLLLGFAKLYDSYRKVLRARGKVIAPVGKYGRVWVINPRRAWRAMLVGTDIASDDVDQTLRLARIWQTTNRGLKLRGKIDKAARVDRSLRKLAAWNAVYTDAGLPTVVLPRIMLDAVTVDAAPTPPPAPEPVRTPRPQAPAAPAVTAPDYVPDDLVAEVRRDRARTPSSAPTSPAPAGIGSRKQDPTATYADIIAELDAVRTDPARGWKGAVPTDGEIEAAAQAVRTPDDVPSKGTRFKIRSVFVARLEAAG